MPAATAQANINPHRRFENQNAVNGVSSMA